MIMVVIATTDFEHLLEQNITDNTKYYDTMNVKYSVQPRTITINYKHQLVNLYHDENMYLLHSLSHISPPFHISQCSIMVRMCGNPINILAALSFFKEQYLLPEH